MHVRCIPTTCHVILFRKSTCLKLNHLLAKILYSRVEKMNIYNLLYINNYTYTSVKLLNMLSRLPSSCLRYNIVPLQDY